MKKLQATLFLLGSICSLANGDTDEFWTEQAKKEDTEAIMLAESTIRPGYVEVEAVSATKNVKVITREQIENKGYNTLSEVLQEVPSINVSKTGYGEIDIRGQGGRTASRNVQVMVDGAPIGALTQHPYKTDYNIVPVNQIEKIEIIEGGGSVLYGSGTSGGVINITTNLKTLSKPKNSIGYEFETDNKQRYNASIGTNITDDLVVQLDYSKEDSDLYFVDTFKKSEYFGAGLSYRLTDKQVLSLKYTHFEEEGKYIYNISKRNLKEQGKDYKPAFTDVIVGWDEEKGEYIRERRRRYNQSTRKSEGLKASYFYDITDDIEIMADVYGQWGSFRNSHYEDKDMKYNNYGVKTKLSYEYMEDSKLLIGVDYGVQNSTLEVPRHRKGFKDKFDYEKETKAIYIHNKIALGDFEFTQGARKDLSTWTNQKPEGSTGVSQGTEATFTSERRNEAYEFGAAWLYRDTGRVFARYERGFTVPDGVQMTDDVYIDRTKYYVTTEAEDEIYDTYEIGLRDYVLGSFVTATGFITTTDNEIQRVKVGEGWRKDTKTMNLLETTRYGFELTLEQEFGKLRTFESYSWLKGKTGYNDKGKEVVDSGKQIDWTDSGLQKVPEHTFVIGADYEIIEDLNIGFTTKYTGTYNNYFNESEKEDDSLVKSNIVTDTRASWAVGNGLVVYCGIRNIFNEKYYNYVSTSSTVNPADERSYYTGFTYTF